MIFLNENELFIALTIGHNQSELKQLDDAPYDEYGSEFIFTKLDPTDPSVSP